MRTLAASLAAAAVLAAATAAPAPAASLEKTTTSYATIGGEPAAPYSRLKLLPGWKRVVRDDLGASARKGRLARRRSLLYFAQLSDFQLADEESPLRAEALDLAGSPFISAWRPQEAFEPFTVDEVSARSTASTQARSATGRGAAPAWRWRSRPATRPTTSRSTRSSGSCGCSRAGG